MPMPCNSGTSASGRPPSKCSRSEEHTSELQSPCNLVCRLLLEKKKIVSHRHARAAALSLHALDGLLTPVAHYFPSSSLAVELCSGITPYHTDDLRTVGFSPLAH